VVIKGRSIDHTGKARTAAYYLPEEAARLVKEGMELGDAQDQVFGRTNSKQASGSSGLLTDEAIDRTEVYEHAVILALIPFKKVNLTFPA
jgi:inosine/xanthosine triphosphatase